MLVMAPTRAAQRGRRDGDRYLRGINIIHMASMVDDEEEEKERARADFLVSGLRCYVQGGAVERERE